jgi:hypothetical protein
MKIKKNTISGMGTELLGVAAYLALLYFLALTLR